MPVVALPRCESTNAWAKQNWRQLAPFGAVYTADQTAGRGRLGRSWHNAPGQALYYSFVAAGRVPDAQTLPQRACLAAADALRETFGADCAVKWPNDLLLQGRKLAGILCESTAGPAGRVYVVGVGVNLRQPAADLAAAGLPHATSLAAAGIDPGETAAPRLAEALTRRLMQYSQADFAPLRAGYKAACVNLGRAVTWQTEQGTARGVCTDIDAAGRLVVQTGSGQTAVFTGEVSVQGIYGAV